MSKTAEEKTHTPPPVKRSRKAHDPKHSRKFPACFQCTQRHEKCSNTQNETGFPCEGCKKRNINPKDCFSHFDHPSWVPGVSGATNKSRKRGKAGGGPVQRRGKKLAVRAAREKEESAEVEEEDRRDSQASITERTLDGDEDHHDGNSKAPRGDAATTFAHGEPRRSKRKTKAVEYDESGDHASAKNSFTNHTSTSYTSNDLDPQVRRELDRLESIEAQLDDKAALVPVRKILEIMQERVRAGQENAISSLHRLLARAAMTDLVF